MDPEINPDPLYDTAAAAAYLDTAPSTLMKHRVIGGGPEFVRIGRLVKYRQSALERFIEAGRRRTTSDTEPLPAA